MLDLSFYKGKTVLITGHNGFKGSWLTKILIMSGAKVIGYSLEREKDEYNLIANITKKNDFIEIFGDVRDYDKLLEIFSKYKPDVVFHLAAQALVRPSYKFPHYTFDTNINGTLNICECIRLTSSVKSFINVTTDKVYENNDEVGHRFSEDEKLNGFDPYSNSKSCSDLVSQSYNKSFFKEMHVACSNVRSGNVIGGGDFSIDRIVPDCIRSILNKETMVIRNPESVRPYQHVFEALYCYLLIAEKQYKDESFAGLYNVGPDSSSFSTTKNIVEKVSICFPDSFLYECKNNSGPHEAAFLQLNNEKIKATFGWAPLMNIDDAVRLTCQWYKVYVDNGNLLEISEKQIKEFFGI